ncbi:MAG: hypothetical protein ACI4PG_02175 [Candidatus Ventricola sp.]
MNRLTARSAMALFLLLAALLLTLTCAAAEEPSYSYNEYSWDESTGTLKTNVLSKKLSEMTPINVLDSVWDLGGTSSDPYFYYAAIPSDLDWTEVPVDFITIQGNVSILLLCKVVPRSGEIAVKLKEGSTLNMYTLSSDGFSISAVYDMEAASTLNLHISGGITTFTSNSASSRPTVNCYTDYFYRNLNNAANIQNTILNIYGESRFGRLILDNSTLSLYNGTTFSSSSYSEDEAVVSLTNHSEMNICDGQINLRGERILYCEENSTLNFCPRGENGYYGIFSSTTLSQDSLIGAFKGKAPDDLFGKINNSKVVSMVRMTAIGIDKAPQTCYVDESPRFQVNVLTEGVSSGSFTVEYKQNGAYSTTQPTQPGTYDVKITRPMDDTYLPFEQEILGGLVITKHSQTAPTGVAAVAETLAGTNDGRLTGVTADMEYRAEDSRAYTAVTGTEVTGLAPGTYFVRYRETATHFASADVKVTVAAGRADYRITRGDGASVIAGQHTALSFTANGPLDKLDAVLVDGQTLDAKHYTAESGSTIITLSADYVKTLPVGGHTLTVRYTDGETSAHFTVAAMPQDLPKTGDSSHLLGWAALLGACCAGLWCLNRRRG